MRNNLDLLLTHQEQQDIEQLARDVVRDIDEEKPVDWIDLVAVASAGLPRSLRKEIYAFRRSEEKPWLRIRNFPSSPEALPPTPHTAGECSTNDWLRLTEVIHCLVCTCLGEPFGWSSHQGGRVVTDILPQQEKKGEFSGAGSALPFGLHTEDAFHPNAPDYLGLACLRNPEVVPTIVSTVAGLRLARETTEVLFQNRFFVGANVAHAVEQPREPTSILFGSPAAPYMRVNLNVQGAVIGDDEAKAALTSISQGLIRNVVEVPLEPGDILLIDNYRTAHGRPSFQPRFDGSDRWLKRIFIAGTLRASRGRRTDARSRVVIAT